MPIFRDKLDNKEVAVGKILQANVYLIAFIRKNCTAKANEQQAPPKSDFNWLNRKSQKSVAMLI